MKIKYVYRRLSQWNVYNKRSMSAEKINRLAGNVIGEYVSPRGGVTEARLYLNDNTVIVAKAICSIKDNFNKKTGRALALGRLVRALCLFVTCPPDCPATLCPLHSYRMGYVPENDSLEASTEIKNE